MITGLLNNEFPTTDVANAKLFFLEFGSSNARQTAHVKESTWLGSCGHECNSTVFSRSKLTPPSANVQSCTFSVPIEDGWTCNEMLKPTNQIGLQCTYADSKATQIYDPVNLADSDRPNAKSHQLQNAEQHAMFAALVFLDLHYV